MPHRERMYSVFRNEALFCLGALTARDLPQFAMRLARWIYAETREGRYGVAGAAYFARAPLEGLLVRLLLPRRRVAR